MSQDAHSAKELMSTSDMNSISRGRDFPNRWAKVRHRFRAPLAEFLGMVVFVTLGTAGNAQGTLYSNTSVSAMQAGGWLSVAAGWGAGLGAGVYITAGISGGHLNPAVTLALATCRQFSWKKVPIYIAAQLLGAIIGSAFTYGIYHNAIDIFEGGAGIRSTPGTASLFGTYPASYLSSASAFFEEFLGAFILLVVICTTTDPRNGPVKPGFTAIVLGLALFLLGMTFGPQTGFAFNPARDLGPRILTAMAGYGRSVFTYRHAYWIWGGILAPILGALIGVLAYDALVYTGSDAIVNYTPSAARNVRHSSGSEEMNDKAPSGANAC